MKRYLQLIMMAIAFDAYWTLVVVFRERGVIVWLILALIAWLMLSPANRLYAILLAAAGSGMDALLALTGLINFNSDALMPLWMVALWLMFASVWTGLTTTSTLPGWLLGLLAAFGGPVAYLVGKHLGGLVFLQPTIIVVSWMFSCWLVLMLVFHLLMGRRQ